MGLGQLSGLLCTKHSLTMLVHISSPSLFIDLASGLLVNGPTL